MFRVDGIYPILTLLFSSFSLSFFILFIYLFLKEKHRFQAVTYLWFKKKQKPGIQLACRTLLSAVAQFRFSEPGQFRFPFPCRLPSRCRGSGTGARGGPGAVPGPRCVPAAAGTASKLPKELSAANVTGRFWMKPKPITAHTRKGSRSQQRAKGL